MVGGDLHVADHTLTARHTLLQEGEETEETERRSERQQNQNTKAAVMTNTFQLILQIPEETDDGGLL